jgi:hypothetical protein
MSIADIISTVEFDHTGNYLATGDKGGRVVLFERNETVSSCPLMHYLYALTKLLWRSWSNVATEENMRI